MKLQLLLPALLLGCSSLSGEAQLINIAIDPEFTTSGSVTMSGAALLGSAGDQWNLLTSVSSTGMALSDAGGTATGVTFAYSGFGGVNWSPSYAGSYVDVNAGLAPGLLDNVIFYADATATLTLSGLAPSTTYDLVLYTQNFNNGQDVTFTVNGLAGTIQQTQNAVFTSTLVDVPPLGDAAYTVMGNYIRFLATTDGSGNLNMTETNAPSGNDFFSFNGLQVTVVPEPATYGLLIAGLAMIYFSLARKQRRDF